MRYVRLIGYEDEPTGNIGLIVKGTKSEHTFAASGGDLIAHDLLEHQNGVGAIGCPGDELEAMGGVWQVRGRHGSLFQKRVYGIHSPVDAIGMGDIVNIATDWNNQENPRWYPRFEQYRIKPHVHDDDFMEILEIARDSIPRNLDSETMEHFPLEEFLDSALHLMRRGFNKARRRFGDGHQGSETYCAIRDAVEPYARQHDLIGREFLLGYGRGEARCVEVTREEIW